MVSRLCPCGSVKTYTRCCGPYHRGDSKPRTARQLMRSRYSAYALGGLGAYLVQTWHPRKQAELDSAELSIASGEWLGLTINDASQDADTASVEFTASYQDSNGNCANHHEISRFERINGQWYYVDGDIGTAK